MKSKRKNRDNDAFIGVRNRLVGAVAMLIGMAAVIIGISESFPQGAVDSLGIDVCKYVSIGFGGLLTAAGIVYLIRG